jgi:hypothetical protein
VYIILRVQCQVVLLEGAPSILTLFVTSQSEE